MTNKEIIDRLEQRWKSTADFEYAEWGSLYELEKVQIKNDLEIMSALKAILTNIEEGKEERILNSQ